MLGSSAALRGNSRIIPSKASTGGLGLRLGLYMGGGVGHACILTSTGGLGLRLRLYDDRGMVMVMDMVMVTVINGN